MSGEDDSDALVTSATATMMTAVQAMIKAVFKSIIKSHKSKATSCKTPEFSRKDARLGDASRETSSRVL